MCMQAVIDDWKRGMIDYHARKTVAYLEQALGWPARVWPDEGGPEELE